MFFFFLKVRLGATNPHGVHAGPVWALFHVKITAKFQLQLQVVVHRQSVLAVGVLGVGSRPEGAGDLTPALPWQILGAAHCVQSKNFLLHQTAQLVCLTIHSSPCLLHPNQPPPSLPSSVRLLHFLFSLSFVFCSRSHSLSNWPYQCKCVHLHPSSNRVDTSSSSPRCSCGRSGCTCCPDRLCIRQRLREKTKKWTNSSRPKRAEKL